MAIDTLHRERTDERNHVDRRPHTNSREDVSKEPTPEGWSARRAGIDAAVKEAMAGHFVGHDFLRDNHESPNGGYSVTSASIIVNPGTVPNVIVQKSLESIEEDLEKHPEQGAPHIIWYTPGALVPSTLREARVHNKLGKMRSASRLYLFPGLVDPDREMVLDEEAVDFIEKQQNICFTYALLSAYAFDICSGMVFFFFPEEVRLQKAVALREAAHKFLFLEPAKFRRDGKPAYAIRDLLESANASVTIYTVKSERHDVIEQQFRNLANTLLDPELAGDPEAKTLRLVQVGEDKSNIPVTGKLRPKSNNK